MLGTLLPSNDSPSTIHPVLLICTVCTSKFNNSEIKACPPNKLMMSELSFILNLSFSLVVLNHALSEPGVRPCFDDFCALDARRRQHHLARRPRRRRLNEIDASPPAVRVRQAGLGCGVSRHFYLWLYWHSHCWRAFHSYRAQEAWCFPGGAARRAYHRRERFQVVAVTTMTMATRQINHRSGRLSERELLGYWQVCTTCACQRFLPHLTPKAAKRLFFNGEHGKRRDGCLVST